MVSNIFIFHFIYELSSFPLTNLYFSEGFNPPTSYNLPRYFQGMNIPDDPSNFCATPCTIRMDFAKSRRAANLWGGPYPAWMVVNIWLFHKYVCWIHRIRFPWNILFCSHELISHISFQMIYDFSSWSSGGMGTQMGELLVLPIYANLPTDMQVRCVDPLTSWVTPSASSSWVGRATRKYCKLT